LVYLVCFVHLVGLALPNKRDKPKKPNNGLLLLNGLFEHPEAMLIRHRHVERQQYIVY